MSKRVLCAAWSDGVYTVSRRVLLSGEHGPAGEGMRRRVLRAQSRNERMHKMSSKLCLQRQENSHRLSFALLLLIRLGRMPTLSCWLQMFPR